MTEREKYIKQVFKNYRKNKARLKKISFESLRASSTLQPKAGKRAKGYENSLIGYIDEKIMLEKSVELVERTLYHYEIYELAFADGKAHFIRCRFINGMSVARSSLECFISDGTACNWFREIKETAAAIAEIYSLWG